MGSLKIIVQHDQILVNSMGKLSFFSTDGVFKREIKSRYPLGHYNPLGDKFVGHTIASGDDKLSYIAINLYDSHDSQLLKGKEIYRFLHPVQQGKNIDIIYLTRLPLLSTFEDKIFIDDIDGVIHVFNEKGEKIFDITSEKFKKIKITQAHKKKYINFFKTDSRYQFLYERDKGRIKFPEYFPKIRLYLVADKNIYVLTFLKEKEKSEFLIFSLDGRFLKRAMLPLHEMNPIEIYPYTIKENIFYQLLESDIGDNWDLHATEIK